MTTIHGFQLIHEELIPELNTQARVYRHIKSGARLLSLSNEDENKCFGITFRTPPADSTGIAHILEHSVLGGSRKYPVKEPFVELLKGSLKTYLNASTFPDKTAYPVASTNAQDFYNLVDVYLDAVFYPLITPHHLDQEGWHYELENPDDPLKFKGVVFNEMKGAYSSPDGLFARNSRQSLFPGHTYGHDSGGDPKTIPDLTYAQFKSFHETYYHPSNAYIYFYGDDDPTERLRLLDGYLRDFDARVVDSAIPLQQSFDEPQRHHYVYSVDANDEGKSKAMIRLNWLLPEVTDPATSMSLGMLSHALLSMASSPLRKMLTDAGLGEDVIGGGFGGGLRQPTFAVGLKGVDVDALGRAEELIVETLASLARDGIEPDTIEAAVNTVEFRLCENNTGSYPRGLSLMYRALGTWLYDDEPLIYLRYEAALTEAKTRLAADSGYFQQLLHDYLLTNPHRTTTIMTPDPALAAREEAAEQARLAAARAAMNADDLDAVIEKTRQLKHRQEAPDAPEALAAIPRLKLSDLEREIKTIPIAVSDLNDSRLLTHDLFTNGIVYLDVGFNMHTLPVDLLPYLGLFGQALTEMGTETQSFVQLQQRIGMKTGGVSASRYLSSADRANGAAPIHNDSVAWFFLHGKATLAQAGDMLDIMRDVLLTVNLDDRDRFRQIVLKSKARHEAGLIPSGSAIVGGRLNAMYSVASWASEQMGGVNNLFFLRELVNAMENDWPGVLAKLEQIRTTLISRNAMLCNVTLDDASWSDFAPRLAEFVAAFPAQSHPLQVWQPELVPVHEGLTIPAQVNYVAKGAPLYDLGYQLHGSILPITNFLRTGWLWEKVRVQGGAYGGLVRFDRYAGVLAFLSYRDPNLLGTVDVYDRTASHLRALDLSHDELTKSIIGAISSLDGHQLPDAKGYTSMLRYLHTISDEERQRYRDEVLATSAEHFRAFADVLEEMNRAGTVVVLGSPDAIQAANQARNDFLRVHKVM